MSQQDVETIRGGYEAFARQDIPAVLGLMAPEIEWDVPDTLPNGGTHRGPDAVGSFFAGLAQTWAELRVEPEQYLDAGDHVVVLGTHRGRGNNGTPFEARFVHVWALRDGKAVRFRETADTAKLLPALEAQPG
jgi:uncharacterized protein